jgi:hypothetical protein
MSFRALLGVAFTSAVLAVAPHALADVADGPSPDQDPDVENQCKTAEAGTQCDYDGSAGSCIEKEGYEELQCCNDENEDDCLYVDDSGCSIARPGSSSRMVAIATIVTAGAAAAFAARRRDRAAPTTR